MLDFLLDLDKQQKPILVNDWEYKFIRCLDRVERKSTLSDKQKYHLTSIYEKYVKGTNR